MKKYGETKKCSKCGKLRFMKYPDCQESEDQFHVEHYQYMLKDEERLKITCPRCHYIFYEECLS